MLEGLKYFCDLLNIGLEWPAIIVGLATVSCFFPYKPEYKIKRHTKEKNGEIQTEYFVWKHR